MNAQMHQEKRAKLDEGIQQLQQNFMKLRLMYDKANEITGTEEPPEEVCRVKVMVFNATFNNILVISWWSGLLVEETRVSGENHRLCRKSLTSFSHDVSNIPHHDGRVL
jgi:hypothetical protein